MMKQALGCHKLPYTSNNSGLIFYCGPHDSPRGTKLLQNLHCCEYVCAEKGRQGE